MTTTLTTFNPEQKQILLDTICKGCSTENFLFMLELAKKYGLDPFARQIYCTKVGIIVSRDGLLAIAHRSGDFDGIQTEFTHDKAGNIISSTTTVWRKNISHPFVETAYWAEYAKDTEVWNKFKHPMMQKCSERMALSKAYAITGLYAEEELSPNPRPPVDSGYIDVEPLPAEEPVKPAPLPETAPAKKTRAVAPPTKNLYTEQQAKDAIHRMQQLSMATGGLMEAALIEPGIYNADVINEAWKAGGYKGGA